MGGGGQINKRINTPRGLGFTLGWNGGMANVMVQVVQTDKTRLVMLEKKWNVLSNK